MFPPSCTVVVHIVAGPPLLKYALGQAGETEEGRLRELVEATNLDAEGQLGVASAAAGSQSAVEDHSGCAIWQG